MKFFPTKNYKLELMDNPEKCIEVLKSKTLESDRLSTTKTNKEFIGQIDGTHFEIIGSEVGIGVFTVLKGNFSSDSVNVTIEINKPFKILISILFVFSIGVIFYNAFKIGFPKAFGLLIPLIMLVVLIRFIFFGSFFKRSSDLIFRKFTKLLNAKLNHKQQ